MTKDPHTHARDDIGAMVDRVLPNPHRTAKTACNKRRLVASLVDRDKATCPECRQAIDSDRAEFADMEASARELGLM
jgi:hypothetical protein